MLLDNSELYRLAASLAGIIHKKVKRHGGVVNSVVEVGRKDRAELLAGKNLGNAFLLAKPLGRMNSRQEGKLTDGL
ncbi:MAG: hypothetical protein ACLP19_26690 [Xanthobacteraceae bacterium]